VEEVRSKRQAGGGRREAGGGRDIPGGGNSSPGFGVMICIESVGHNPGSPKLIFSESGGGFLFFRGEADGGFDKGRDSSIPDTKVSRWRGCWSFRGDFFLNSRDFGEVPGSLSTDSLSLGYETAGSLALQSVNVSNVFFFLCFYKNLKLCEKKVRKKLT
jgi:hypothetical protein